MRLPEGERARHLKTELAILLYTQEILPFGKACELAEMTRLEFGLLLGRRGIPRRYTDQDLQDDLNYALR
jgi:predicted HTH domain antitoxin